ncbi:WD40 repeat domain-containing serine/threonine protein kinase [Nocardiopsis oceani]
MRPLIPQDPEQIGRYRLTHRLGTGGMGQVYLARTPSGIQVVVKVVRASLLEDAELTEGGTDYRERFAREADLASRVGGFYTAEVVDCDPRADRPWIAYAYIRGLSLKEFLQLKGPFDPPSLRALAAGLGEGLQAIHGNGLIHRDLKPSNVILSEDGPRIIDFGVARPVQGSSMTGTGHVFGTLPYMSPEQAEGTPLSPASDLFALGTTLAHAATGDSPFDTSSNPRTLMRLVGPPPVHLLTALPEDLRSLISACWSHDPAQRPTPRQVVHRCTSAGLDRTWPPRDGDQNVPAALPPPTRPEPPGQGPRGGVLLALAGSVLALLVGITVWLVASADGDTGGLAAPTPPDPTNADTAPDTEPANVRWAGEWAGEEPSGLLGDTDGADLWPLAVSPDGSLVATGSGQDSDAQVQLWETEAGMERGALQGHDRRLRDLAFSHDGSLLASAGWDGTVRVWDVANEEEDDAVETLTDHTDQVRSVAFDPTGGLMATGAADGNVHLWDTEDFELLDTLEHDHGVLKVAFSPDGTTLATSSSPGTDTPGVVGDILLWDLGSLEQVQEYPLTIPEGADNESARALSFDADGAVLAAAGVGGVIHLWDVDDPEAHEVVAVLDERSEDPVRSTIHELAFSPDGTAMATVGSDTLVRVWDVDQREELHQLTRHSAFTRGAAFSPDGATLYTCADDGTVRVWPAPS